MRDILTQSGLSIVKPISVYVKDIYVMAEIWRGEGGRVSLGMYRSKDRAVEILKEIFQTEYYEMPWE